MVVVLAGVSGSGKTTVGLLLAKRLGCVFEDGDALHPASNIAKMHAGIPLTDEDRWPWLQRVGSWIDQQAAAGASSVIACSALKRSYRDFLRQGRPAARVVMLNVDRDALAARLSERHGHFFPAALLNSQLTELEPPAPGEPCLVVAAAGSPAEVVEEIIRGLGGPQPGYDDLPNLHARVGSPQGSDDLWAEFAGSICRATLPVVGCGVLAGGGSGAGGASRRIAASRIH